MKTTKSASGIRVMKATLLAACALLSSGGVQAANFYDSAISGIDLGASVRGFGSHTTGWAIFSLSGGVTITNVSLPTDPNWYNVHGDIAVAGTGNLTMTNSRVYNEVWLRYNATKNLSGGSYVRGGFRQETSSTASLPVNLALSTGVSNATSAANTAFGKAAATTGLTFTGTGVTATNISMNNTAGSITASNAAAYTNATFVLKLQDLVMSGANAVLTLTGLSTQNFVINMSRYMTLNTAAKIQLAGGLTPKNVLFNLGTGSSNDVTLGAGSIVRGIILAQNRAVRLSGASKVYGQVIAKSVFLTQSSQVMSP